MKTVLVHESGNISLVDGGVHLEIRNPDGTLDQVVERREAKGLTDEQFAEKLSNPNEFDVGKFAGRVIEEEITEQPIA